ncbi:MAG: allantoate amidohydrolase [Planctomycetota bacterium]
MRTREATSIDFDTARRAAQRVLDRSDHLARHTDEEGRITRLYLSPAAKLAHDELRGWMKDAGLRVRTDDAGNLIGRRAAGGSPDAAAPVLLLGSHLDTVPNAGRYDGVLGVLVALAAVEEARGGDLPFHVDVLGFSEEEGVRFSLPYLGSAAVAGAFDRDWLRRTDASGKTMRWAIEEYGLDARRIPEAAYDRDKVVGYVEVHLEQGPVLHAADQALGVVTAIQGQSRLRVRLIGAPAHAGTTPQEQRQDALVAASRLVLEAQSLAESVPGLRATVGQVRVWPNVRNVVPGQAELSLDLRHERDDVRQECLQRWLDAAERVAESQRLRFEVLDAQSQPAAPMDPALSDALAAALGDVGVESPRLPSGAGHDAVVMAGFCPSAMLFVRDPAAISHHPDEQVDPEDVARAVQALTALLARLGGPEGAGMVRR